MILMVMRKETEDPHRPPFRFVGVWLLCYTYVRSN